MVSQSQAVKKRDKKQLLQSYYKSVTKIYYKVRQVLQSVSGNTKCDRLLLQSASGITMFDIYYKVRRNTCLKFADVTLSHEKGRKDNYTKTIVQQVF